MQWMTEKRLLDSALGQANFSILMLQDLAVVPIMILSSVLAKGETTELLPVLGLVLLKSVSAIF